MPLNISTVNGTGLTLYATIDKVTANGISVVPAVRWSVSEEAFVELDEIGDEENGYVELTETSGLYSVDIANIDGLTEMLRITIYNESNLAIGTYVSIPVENFVAPEVVIDLNVTEDRS